jgi:hypothetical protein
MLTTIDQVLLCYNEASIMELRGKHTRWRDSTESSARGCIEDRNVGTSQVCKPKTK